MAVPGPRSRRPAPSGPAAAASTSPTRSPGRSTNGRDREAVRYADLALRLGTRDASFLFHAGMIRLALGDRALALDLLRRARATNPWFSVRWSPVLDRVLERLDGSGATGP
jgi:hypothetical protein